VLAHRHPWSLEIGALLFLRIAAALAGNGERADSRQFGEDRHRGRIEDHRLAAGLAVGQEQQK